MILFSIFCVFVIICWGLYFKYREKPGKDFDLVEAIICRVVNWTLGIFFTGFLVMCCAGISLNFPEEKVTFDPFNCYVEWGKGRGPISCPRTLIVDPDTKQKRDCVFNNNKWYCREFKE